MLINGFLGLLFAMCARGRLRADGVLAVPAFSLVIIFAGFIIVPRTVYLYWVHPAWSWLYLVDPDEVPLFVDVALIIVLSGSLMGGWCAGALFIRREKVRGLLIAMLGVGLVAVGAGALLAGRIVRYGTYAAYADGTTVGLMQVKLGYVLIAQMLGLTAAIAFVIIELRRDSQRARIR